jgi:uncharacterized protein YutE (UPF0331/DUF86 family)
MSDVHVAKIASIQRSVSRAREEFAAAGDSFAEDLTRQDAAALNVLRACETAIDLANALIRERKFGVPASNRDSFRLLAEAGLIPADLAARCQKMVGFRNIAVHRYRDVDVAVLASIIRSDLDDLLVLSATIARAE